MTAYPPETSREITHYASVLRSQWRPILAGIAVGLLAATGVLAFSGASHTASTDLNINVISTDPFNAQRSASGLLDGVTEAQIANSYAVAQRAAELLDQGTTPEELRQGAEASTVADATIIRISYEAATPNDARAGADALAEAYLSYRADQARERLSGVIDRIEERLGGLREDLTSANSRAAASEPGTTEANQAASDRELVTIEIDSLLEEKNALDLIDTSGGSVLSSASENEVASGFRPLPVLLTGMLAGLVLGVVVAFIMNAMNRRLVSTRDVEEATGGSLLARFPSRHPTMPLTGEALDELRTARERIYAMLDPEWNVITFFDLTGAHHPSDLPVGLALVFAQDGQPTRLVLPRADRDFRDFLVSSLDLDEVETSSGGSRYGTADGMFWLYVPDTTDEGDTSFLTEATASAEDDELVIISLSPDTPHATALVAGRLAGAIAVLVALGGTNRSQITRLKEEPALAGTAFLGAMAVSASRAPATSTPRTEEAGG
jgi:capsular polysaccharide biosynthesis protein